MTQQLFALDTVGESLGVRSSAFLLLEGELNIRLDLELVLRRRFPEASIKRISNKHYPSSDKLVDLLDCVYDLIVLSLPLEADGHLAALAEAIQQTPQKPLLLAIAPDTHAGHQLLQAGVDRFICPQVSNTYFATLLESVLSVRRCVDEYPIPSTNWYPVELLHNSENSCVLLAKNHQGQSAVIKRFKLETQLLDEQHLQLFKDTVNHLKSLTQSGLVTIYDVYADYDSLYFVMEYVEADTLKDFLKEDDLPILAQRLAWFKAIVEALGHLHEVGLLHRDLKSSNIMIRDNGQPVLLDFGLENQLLIDSGFLRADEIYCTPYYVSPERVLGDSADVASDIYALGVLFYELLTGEKPYEGSSLTYILKSHLLAPIPDLPDELKQYQPLLNQLMAKLPEDRPQQAKTILSALAVVS